MSEPVALLTATELRSMLEEAAEAGARRALSTRPEAALLSAEAMAARLGVHPKVLVGWARRGRVPARKLGTRWRFVEAEVLAACPR